MSSKNLLFLLIISIITAIMYGCMAPTKTGEVAKPSTESKTEAQQTESKKIIEGLDQYEPNNSKERASKIEVGSEIKGTIYPRRDKDFYKFTIDASKNKNLLIEMTDSGGRLEPVMVVYGPDGKIVDRVTPKKRGANLTAAMFPRSGDYYVEISDQKHGQSTKPYVLKLTTEKKKEEEVKPSEDIDFTID